MVSYKRLNNIVGWTVFAIATIVYALTVERTGSLWDCGEFIAGAYKLQVVHPPGAPLFLMIGRMFTWVASIFTDVEAHPENIAYSVNLMSGICTAFAAMFVCWSTTILAKKTLVDNDDEMSQGEQIAIVGGGLVAGLATAFATSIWFSAVEGEVYAMSTFFTTLVIWCSLKWYQLPDNKDADRWLILATYMAGLSIGVHLLSLLSFPFIGILYYLKKSKKTNFFGMLMGAAAGVGVLVVVQYFIILKLPGIGASFDKVFVNTFGLPYFSGFIFFILLLIGGLVFGLNYAKNKVRPDLHKVFVGLSMIMIGFSTYGTIVIRAQANTPINMNDPSDVFSFVSYLNREQYGDRPLLYGPHYGAKPVKQDIEDRFGPKDGSYAAVDRKITNVYRSQDNMLFPRMGHFDREGLYKNWMGRQGVPTSWDNIKFFFGYQINWMYWRYFMWNFVGRQNGAQGYSDQSPANGNWMSGITALDNAKLYNQAELPESMRNHKARNHYYFLPLIFGLIGLFFFFGRNQKDALATIGLFLMTGIAIILYSNQPPNEPRERDYVLVGSIAVFCMWMGLAVPAIYAMLKEQVNLQGSAGAIAATGLVLVAPFLMASQNWDDHSRAEHTGSRDYASNFLESCAKNAIIFTHGDNDTYPLWYAQEVENIRTDVRVVNLSLLAVDWYIGQLTRAINKSPKIEMTIPKEGYRGFKRNFSRYQQNNSYKGYTPLKSVISFMAKDQVSGSNRPVTYLPTKTLMIPVDKRKVLANGTVALKDTAKIVDAIRFTVNKDILIKDELAILDIIASNNWDRPIYFAVTCKAEKTLGLGEYLQMEGMSMRLVPIRTPKTGRYNFMAIMGNGRIEVDTMYNNIMTKYRWGNFDKGDLFVDRSYNPSVMSTGMGFIRLTEALIEQGDTARAKNVVDKYFEAFPHKNFPHDYNGWLMMRQYFSLGVPESAAPHLLQMAKETYEQLNFVASLRKPSAISAFNTKSQQYSAIMQEFKQRLPQIKNEELRKQIKGYFDPFDIAQPPN